MRVVGTSARGIRLPVISSGTDVVPLIVSSLLEASKGDRDGFQFREGDIVGVTESLVARSQGNYVTEEDMIADLKAKLGDGDVALLFPILSRNRFLALLKAVAKAVTGTLHVVLSYPSDEVGNAVMNLEDFYRKQGSLPVEGFDEETYRQVFGQYKHPFTEIDYVQLYKDVSPKIKIWFSQSPLFAAKLAKTCLVSSIHLREIHRELLSAEGMKVVTLADVCAQPVHEGAGFNPDYGLLGSNFSGEGIVKLFPRDCDAFVERLQKALFDATGVQVECLIYGDGAFKDPIGGIWELADPVVSPAHSQRLKGLPHEIKLKYIADNSGQSTPQEAVQAAIHQKKGRTPGQLELGTTPRRYSDLVGSLCDLVSGSGDKGTPVIYLSGYFDTYIDE